MEPILLHTIDTTGYADDLEPHNPRSVNTPATLTAQQIHPTLATVSVSSSLTASEAAASATANALTTSTPGLAIDASTCLSPTPTVQITASHPAPLLTNNEITMLFVFIGLLLLSIAALAIGWIVLAWWHWRCIRILRSEIENMRAGRDANEVQADQADVRDGVVGRAGGIMAAEIEDDGMIIVVDDMVVAVIPLGLRVD